MKMRMLSYVLMTVLATFVLSIGIANAAPVKQGQGAGKCGHWQVVKSPNGGKFTNFLNSVVALSSSDVWAVGYDVKDRHGQGFDQTLIEQWNGTTWSIVKSPNPATEDELYGAAQIPGTNDLWAVGGAEPGYNMGGQALIEQWDGTRWKVIKSPSVPGSSDNGLDAIVANSADDAWATGSYVRASDKSNLTLIEHWDGSNWTIAKNPQPGPVDSLAGIAAASSNDIWAVGTFEQGDEGPFHALIEHWDGTGWTTVKGGKFNFESWLSAAAVVPGTSEVWSVGNYFNGLNAYFTFTESYC